MSIISDDAMCGLLLNRSSNSSAHQEALNCPFESIFLWQVCWPSTVFTTHEAVFLSQLAKILNGHPLTHLTPILCNLFLSLTQILTFLPWAIAYLVTACLNSRELPKTIPTHHLNLLKSVLSFTIVGVTISSSLFSY